MTPTILSLILATQFAVVSAVPGWNSDYAAAVDVARRQQRPLVVVLEDGSHRQQTASILANPAVRMTLLGCSVCRLDVGTRGGAAVADRLQATSFPYTVVSDRTGRHIVFRGSGELSEETWLNLLGDAIGEPDGAEVDRNPGLSLEANRENERTAGEKPALRVVAVGTNGCAYCERLKVETLADAEVRSVLERGMKLEYDNASENDALAREHGVTVFPSILVLTDGGELVDRVDGFVGPTELAARLQKCSDLWGADETSAIE